MKKIFFILLLAIPLALQAQFSKTYTFSQLKNLSSGWLVFDYGSEAATGSDAVAERLAHAVFVGVGEPIAGSVGPHPANKYVHDDFREPLMEVWQIKALSKPEEAYVIEHRKTDNVFTVTPAGKIALEPFQKGNKAQYFRLENDPAFLYALSFVAWQSGLTVTVQNEKLVLRPNNDESRNQVWYANEEDFYDFVYEANGPGGILAYYIGERMQKMSKHDKAKSYYQKAQEIEPDNPRLHELLGDSYMEYNREKATEFYEKAFTLNNKDAEFCARLGIKALQANVANGLEYCRKANEIAPGSVDFTKLTRFQNGMGPVKTPYDKKYGVINLKGELITKEWYDYASIMYQDIVAAVQKDDRWRSINKQGEFIGPWMLAGSRFYGRLASFKCSEDQWGVMDSTGQIVVPCKYKNVKIVNDMVLVKNQDGKAKVFSGDGEPITDKWYEGGWGYALNIMPALKENGKWRYMNSSGKFIKGEYNNLKAFTQGVAFVENDEGMWGAIDTKGNVVVPYQYHGVKGVCNGMVAIENEDEEFAIINTEGEMLSDDWYNDAFVNYKSTMIALQKKNLLGKRWFYVNENGEQVGKKYRALSRFSEGYAFAKRLGKWGVISEQGEHMTGFKYDEYKTVFKNGRAIVEQDGNTFYINPHGERVEKKLLEP